MCGESLSSMERGCPIPPAAPKTQTLVAAAVAFDVEEKDMVERDEMAAAERVAVWKPSSVERTTVEEASIGKRID
jgi:hypothetical protein